MLRPSVSSANGQNCRISQLPGHTRGEEKFSLGNTPPYRVTASLIFSSNSGNANFRLVVSSSSSSLSSLGSFSSSDTPLSIGLAEDCRSPRCYERRFQRRATDKSSDPSGRNTPSDRRYSWNSCPRGLIIVDLMLNEENRGYHDENWNARSASEVRLGKREGCCIAVGIASDYVLFHSCNIE